MISFNLCVVAVLVSVATLYLKSFVFNGGDVTYYSHSVVDTFSSDESCFVQGITRLNDSSIIQCCGIYGKSRIQTLNLKTGQVSLLFTFGSDIFIEGCTRLSTSTLIALTWKEKKLFVFDLVSNSLVKTVYYPYEGWGLTSDGLSTLWATNGSSSLITLDSNYTVKSTCQVTLNNQPVKYLNALAHSDGLIYANVYINVRPPLYPNYIVRFDLACRVNGVIPIFGLHKPKGLGSVLNGIIAEDDGLIVTGKQWPKLFKIKVTPTAIHETWKSEPLEKFMTGPDPLR